MSRLSEGHAWEDTVAADLDAKGWRVARIGQGMLTDDAHFILRQIGLVRVRFIPDLVAFKAGTTILIDAKYTPSRWTPNPNHAVQDASHESLMTFTQPDLGLDAIYAFPHGARESYGPSTAIPGYITPEKWYEQSFEGWNSSGYGSGTPYRLSECNNSCLIGDPISLFIPADISV